MNWIPVLAAIGVLAAGCSSARPANLGVQGGKLAPCPDRPNCVSTYEEDPGKRMDPLKFEGTDREALARLLGILRSKPRTKIVSTVALEGKPLSYIGVEFTSRIFRFVDDVEFVVDGESKTIHFRSASRLGYSDLGANRSRMEEISKEFSQKP